MSEPVLFALDQNYPPPLVESFRDYLSSAELVPVNQIDPRMAKLADWQLLCALRKDARPWSGLITCDGDFLRVPKTVSAVIETKLAVVITEAAGHDPLIASGLLLINLETVCKGLVRDTPQLWRLSHAKKPVLDPWDEFRKIAKHQNRHTRDLYDQHKVTSEELAADHLASVNLNDR
ncbi:MAG TPA: hypothetical protein VFP52_15725 [Myxococcales bacterium]|nr:hypothetical protein [Myxococcales bacterium]